ncbi:glycosyl hydrolase, partial [candidate division KSB1 bacterium]|nr:glycosyl hydrolase [candidate division KSB1 bacterium]
MITAPFPAPQTKADDKGQGFYDLAFAVSPTNVDEIYTGGVNIWKSTDGGVNWTRKTHWKYNTDPAAYVHADVHHLEFNGANLYTGTDGGFFKSTDGGTTWTDLSAGMNSTQFYRIGSYAGSANLVYGGAQDNTISRYTGSTTWESFLSGDGAECIVDPTNSSIVYMSTQGGSLNRSTNAGATFSSIKSNITEAGA